MNRNVRRDPFSRVCTRALSIWKKVEPFVETIVNNILIT